MGACRPDSSGERLPPRFEGWVLEARGHHRSLDVPQPRGREQFREVAFSRTRELRFGVDGSEGIFLSDRVAWSVMHREHSWSNRGPIVGSDDRTNRYLVAAFPLDTTELRSCEVCGEANAILIGHGDSHVLYTGAELEVAERIWAEAFQ